MGRRGGVCARARGKDLQDALAVTSTDTGTLHNFDGIRPKVDFACAGAKRMAVGFAYKGQH